MADRRFHIVLNTSAGTAHAIGLTIEKLQDLFAGEGLTATIDADEDTPLEQRIERAIGGGAEVIVAAGGDGTVTALAGAIVDGDKALAILPLGTANLLARDLGIPLDLGEAVAELATMELRRIDVGEVNGRIFLNNVTVGLLPEIAVGRERIRGRTSLSSKIGFVRHFLRRLFEARRIAIEIGSADGSRVERVQAVAVANNCYDEGVGQFFSRQRLDDGRLTLYVLKRLTLRDMFRLGTEMFLGMWQDDKALVIESVAAVAIRLRRRDVRVMIDGEVERLQVPLRFRIRPLALSVLAPVRDEVPAEAEEPQVATGS